MARGYMSGVGNGSGSDDCTATRAQLLEGYTGILSDTDDEPAAGAMPHLSNNTPIDFASGNTTPVIVCDAHFYDTNTDGVARMCFRYNGEAGYIVPNTLFGY